MGFNKGISGFVVRGAGNYVRQKAYGFIDSPSPANIATLHAWYAADFGVTFDGGFNISQVNDRSGNGRHATQAVGANQPAFIADGGAIFNNRPVMRFNGTTDFLDVAHFNYVDFNNLNVFIVFKSDDYTIRRDLLMQGERGFFADNDMAYNVFINVTTNIRTSIGEDGDNFLKTTDLSSVLLTTKAYVYSFQFDTTDLNAFLDNVDETSIVANAAMTQFYDSVAGMTIGSRKTVGVPNSFFKGDIPEIVIAGDMSEGQIIDMNDFFIEKYL